MPVRKHPNLYDDRFNRVLNHIAAHLNDDLSLARLSAIGCFSPFHFHRIFQGVTGETLNNRVRRLRLERAALLMRTSPARRITDIALESGFGGTDEFSRAFKAHFGRTASSWDRRSPLEISKIGKAPESHPFHTVEELERWKASANDEKVRVQQVNAFRYVYNRVYAPYGNSKLVDCYHALNPWLAARNTSTSDVVFIGMSQDDPAITPGESAATIWALHSRLSPLAFWAKSSDPGDPPPGRQVPTASRCCRTTSNAKPPGSASAISTPNRSWRSPASEISTMWDAPASITDHQPTNRRNTHGTTSCTF